MRLDKFLKTSRIIKRRTVAKNVAVGEKILLNDKLAKPSTMVKKGDILEIRYYDKKLKFEILEVPKGNISKEMSLTLVKTLEL
jgi:ribosomal 50S subunit-recycling heat shock protein